MGAAAGAAALLCRTASFTGNSWNAADKGSSITLSNNDYDAINTTGSYNSVRAEKGLSTGKWYWEIIVLATAAQSTRLPAAMDGSASLTTYAGNSASGIGYQGDLNGNSLVNGVTANFTGALGNFAVNDVVGFAFDADNDTLYIAKNNTYYNSGNPPAGTGFAVSSMSGTWYPACSLINSGSLRLADGVGVALTYSAPSGFTPYGQAP